jgi:large-conductance mechanosensitive channel
MDTAIEVKYQLAEFISQNNIVGVCAGVLVGFVTKDLILSFVADIVLPIFVILLLKLNIPCINNLLKGKSGLNITKFLGSGITWVLALLITYLFVQYAFFKLLGVKDKFAPPPVSITPTQNQNAPSPAQGSNNFQSINSMASMDMVEGYRNKKVMTMY